MTQKASGVAIIGGGIMGGDIAIIFAAAGWNVHVMSPSQKTRDALPARVAAGLKKLGAPQANAADVKTYAGLEALPWKDIGLVVEAAIEDLPLKQKLFAEVESAGAPRDPARHQHLELSRSARSARPEDSARASPGCISSCRRIWCRWWRSSAPSSRTRKWRKAW